MRHSAAHTQLLRALAEGWALKAHRDIEGRKAFQLHHPDGRSEPADWNIAEALAEQGLIDSNKKFPAATFWLTEKGKQMLAELNRDHATD